MHVPCCAVGVTVGKRKRKEEEGRGRKRKEEKGRGKKGKEGVTTCGCAGIPLRCQTPSEFLQPFIGFPNIGLVFQFFWISQIISSIFWFSPPPPFWFPALLFVLLFFAVSLTFSSLTLMVAPTLRLFSSSLVGFPHPFSCFPPPFRLFSHFVVYPLFCVVFHTFVFEQARGLWRPSFVFTCLLFALSPSLFAFFIVWDFYQSLCVVPALLMLLPFLYLFSLCGFLQSLAVFSFSTPFVLSPYLGFSLLPLGFPPFPFLVLISLSSRAPVEIAADVFSPLLQSFSSLDVCLFMFRSLSLCLSLKHKGTKQ